MIITKEEKEEYQEKNNEKVIHPSPVDHVQQGHQLGQQCAGRDVTSSGTTAERKPQPRRGTHARWTQHQEHNKNVHEFHQGRTNTWKKEAGIVNSEEEEEEKEEMVILRSEKTTYSI